LSETIRNGHDVLVVGGGIVGLATARAPRSPRSPRRTVHVLNAPSPAATASLPIGAEAARRALAAPAAGG
jgi:L-2-hydroxyglutarate oxidase LhgO